MQKKIKIDEGTYISGIQVNDKDVEVNFKKKKKVALVFICLNANYWRYLKQIIEDAKANFLPHHNVNFFAWTDIPMEDNEDLKKYIDSLPTRDQIQTFRDFAKSLDDLNQIMKLVPKENMQETIDFVRTTKDITVIPTEPIEWPHGTLMRYHLFLQKEEELSKYDYIFYLDVDMRIVAKISDEIFSESLTAAEHPMYALDKKFYPPYEPNEQSSAFVPRLSKVVEENGRKRLKPYYVAGGFQGGKAKAFIKAMKVMKANIDKDFNNNYMAIWNDESHWNRYLFEHKGPVLDETVTVLSPSYIYPDSLIKEYYEPLWGRSYEPKIMTITKPWMLTKEAGAEIRKQTGDHRQQVDILLENKFQCEKCFDIFQQPGNHIKQVIECTGKGQPHKLEMIPIKK